MDAGLDIRYDDGVLRLTLDRPDRLNAMSPVMSDGLAGTWRTRRPGTTYAWSC